MGAISNLFGYLLNWLYNIFNNYGIAIIIFSIILRIILMPITIKQQKTMKKSAEMQEKMKDIQRKYRNNPEKLNQETIDLYKREKMSPFSGCFSSILQIVIILAVFYLVSKPLTYMKKVDTEVINNYVNEIREENGTVSAYSEIEVIQKKADKETNPDIYINMDFFGLDLSKVPNQNLGDYTVYIIPALYVITSFISIKLSTKMQEKKKNEQKLISDGETPKTEEELKAEAEQEEILESMQSVNKNMMYMTPIMSIFIAFIAPLGLALYWLVSNILMIIERIIVDKFFKKEDA